MNGWIYTLINDNARWLDGFMNKYKKFKPTYLILDRPAIFLTILFTIKIRFLQCLLTFLTRKEKIINNHATSLRSLIHQLIWLSCPKKNVKWESFRSKWCMILILVAFRESDPDPVFRVTVESGSCFFRDSRNWIRVFFRRSDLDPGKISPDPQSSVKFRHIELRLRDNFIVVQYEIVLTANQSLWLLPITWRLIRISTLKIIKLYKIFTYNS